MTALHEVANKAILPPSATLDDALEPDASNESAAVSKPGAGLASSSDEEASADEAMDELDHVDESDTEALIAAARRLKRARNR